MRVFIPTLKRRDRWNQNMFSPAIHCRVGIRPPCRGFNPMHSPAIHRRDRYRPHTPCTGFKPGAGQAFRSGIPALKCRAKHTGEFSGSQSPKMSHENAFRGRKALKCRMKTLFEVAKP